MHIRAPTARGIRAADAHRPAHAAHRGACGTHSLVCRAISDPLVERHDAFVRTWCSIVGQAGFASAQELNVMHA